MTMKSKNDALRFEINNFDKIAIFASGGFWCATEHSCLFLLNIIGVKAKMHVTYDKYIQKDRIYIAFHSGHFAATRTSIEDSGCELIRKDSDMLVFQMSQMITPEQIKIWMHEEDTKKRKIDAYFLPDSGETKVYGLLRNLGREALSAGNHMRQNVRGVIADRMFVICMNMMREYIKLDKKSDRGETQEVYTKIKSLVGDFSFVATIAYDDGLIEDKRIMRIGVLLKEIVKNLKLDQKDGVKEP